MTTEPRAPGGASLVINRAKWLRGESFTASRLFRPADSRMCCLGFYGLACGLTLDDIRDRKAPQNAKPEKWPAWLLHEDMAFCPSTDGGDLMETNDNPTLPASDREDRIAAIFAKHGVTVTFTDDEASGTATEGSP